jgi:hypothetical protein
MNGLFILLIKFIVLFGEMKPKGLSNDSYFVNVFF